MVRKGQDCRLPRPWYISLTAVWQDDTGNYPKLRGLVSNAEAYPPACNHVPIADHCRHFTVLAIMRLNGFPEGTRDFREFAGRVFEPIRSNNALLGKLCAGFKRFTANVYEVRCFDNAMALQFEGGKPLKEFRDYARTALDAAVSVLVRRHTSSETGRRFRENKGVSIVESILDDPKKNYGTRAFGSIARSPCRSDGSTERWRMELDGACLKFEHVHLLVSDETLSNPRDNAEDVVIS